MKYRDEINGLSFTGDSGNEYLVEANQTSNGLQITVICKSHLGANCVFNETYGNFTIEQLLNDLHEQHLEDVENEIADTIG